MPHYSVIRDYFLSFDSLPRRRQAGHQVFLGVRLRVRKCQEATLGRSGRNGCLGKLALAVLTAELIE
jgi:hypothetical protein